MFSLKSVVGKEKSVRITVQRAQEWLCFSKFPFILAIYKDITSKRWITKVEEADVPLNRCSPLKILLDA